jgi:hypothetical protein
MFPILPTSYYIKTFVVAMVDLPFARMRLHGQSHLSHRHRTPFVKRSRARSLFPTLTTPIQP